MCGIAGILIKPEQTVVGIRERLLGMALAMQHRGPDDEGIVTSPDGRVGLANRRLAVRDLTQAGHMPMGSMDKSVWVTHNGEIYNADELRATLKQEGYVFRSHSDTEVILNGYRAWGMELVHRLRGMFAFAVLSLQPGAPHLFLARDHLGVKPLYYAHTSAAFVFASELRGLLASGLVGAEIDPAALAAYLQLGSVPSPRTIYREVAALGPAEWLVIPLDSVGAPTPHPYWRLPVADSERQPQVRSRPAVEDPARRVGEDQAAAAAVARLLAESVRIRLVSDVPLGAFLSGGLDSSSVVALMRQATSGPIRTCTMTFEEAAYSEAPYARAVAQAAETDHFERVITASEVLSEFDRLLVGMDQPTVDGVNTYFVSQTARQAGLTVALSGLGGDELFGGYPNTFRQAPALLRGLRLVSGFPAGRCLARESLRFLPQSRRSRVEDALARPPSRASAYLAIRGLFSPHEAQALLAPWVWDAACLAAAGWGTARGENLTAYIAERAGGIDSPASVAWTSRAELRTYTHNQLLRDTDVMSMAHSLEVREPLLDVRLVEFVLQLPDAVKLSRGKGPKPLLMRAMGNQLPQIIRKRRDKLGFTFPFAVWLRGPLLPQVQAALDVVSMQDWLQPGATQQVLSEFLTGRAHWSRLWSLVALGSLCCRRS